MTGLGRGVSEECPLDVNSTLPHPSECTRVLCLCLSLFFLSFSLRVRQLLDNATYDGGHCHHHHHFCPGGARGPVCTLLWLQVAAVGPWDQSARLSCSRTLLWGPGTSLHPPPALGCCSGPHDQSAPSLLQGADVGPRGCGASQDLQEPGQVAVAAAERWGHPSPAGSGPDDEDHPPLPPEPEAAAP